MKTKLIVMASLSLIGSIFSSCINSVNKESAQPQFMGYIENTQVNVTGRMPGKIMDIFVDEGDTVKQGENIARLDAREIEANMAAMQSQLRNISLNKNRLDHLFQAGAVPKQKVDEIETAFEVLSSNILALKIKVEDMYVTAPIDGIINVRLLEIGQMLSPGMPVVVITDPVGSWARFSIPEKYINQINLGQQFVLEGNVPGLTYAAKVVQILPMAEFATRTPTMLRDERDVRTFDLKLKLIDAPGRASINLCKPGMYVYLTLKGLSTIAVNSAKN